MIGSLAPWAGLIVAIGCWIAVWCGLVQLCARFLPLRENNIRPEREWMLAWALPVTFALSIPFLVGFFPAWREKESDWEWVLLFILILQPAFVYSLFFLGADISESGITFRRRNGRKIFVAWDEIDASRLTLFGSFYTVRTKDGRNFGLAISDFHLENLHEEFLLRELKRPSMRTFNNARSFYSAL